MAKAAPWVKTDAHVAYGASSETTRALAAGEVTALLHHDVRAHACTVLFNSI